MIAASRRRFKSSCTSSSFECGLIPWMTRLAAAMIAAGECARPAAAAAARPSKYGPGHLRVYIGISVPMLDRTGVSADSERLRGWCDSNSSNGGEEECRSTTNEENFFFLRWCGGGGGAAPFSKLGLAQREFYRFFFFFTSYFYSGSSSSSINSVFLLLFFSKLKLMLGSLLHTPHPIAAL